MPLARDLGPGPHQLELIPDGSGPVVVDAFLVSDEAEALPFYLLGAFCGLLILAGGIVVLRSRYTARAARPEDHSHARKTRSPR